MKNSYAIVTGATSGIGLEISKNLAKRGFNLILVARTLEKLVQTSNDLTKEFNVKCDYFSSDLTLIDSPDEIYQFTRQKNIVWIYLLIMLGMPYLMLFIKIQWKMKKSVLEFWVHLLLHSQKNI